jgi:phage FluMu protein Com
MKTNLRTKCPSCGYWNRILVNKIFLEQPTSEPKVKAYMPMYEPLKVEKCKKCKKVIAEPDKILRF